MEAYRRTEPVTSLIAKMNLNITKVTFIAAISLILSMWAMRSLIIDSVGLVWQPTASEISRDIVEVEPEIPQIIPDYSRTDGFLSMCDWNGQDGVTIFLQKVWSTLAAAILINRTLVMPDLPASAVMRETKYFIPFGDLFDINVFRHAYGPSCCILPNELNETIRKHTHAEWNNDKLLRDYHTNRSQLNVHKHIGTCLTPFDYLTKAQITSVYKNTRPHPALRKAVRSVFKRLQSAPARMASSQPSTKSSVVCLHLRTEIDFLGFFKVSPAAYSQEQVLTKMNLTKTFLTNTTFAKLWIHNTTHTVKPVLYLAGADTNASKTLFMNTGWFAAVYDKSLLLHTSRENTTSFDQLLMKYNASLSLLKALKFDINSVMALMDMEICKSADIFIGNNYSSFSERLASERQMSDRWEGNASRTLENGGQYNYMVNGLNKDTGSLQDFLKLQPLHPFCAKNAPLFLSYHCHYAGL